MTMPLPLAEFQNIRLLALLRHDSPPTTAGYRDARDKLPVVCVGYGASRFVWWIAKISGDNTPGIHHLFIDPFRLRGVSSSAAEPPGRATTVVENEDFDRARPPLSRASMLPVRAGEFVLRDGGVSWSNHRRRGGAGPSQLRTKRSLSLNSANARSRCGRTTRPPSSRISSAAPIGTSTGLLQGRGGQPANTPPPSPTRSHPEIPAAGYAAHRRPVERDGHPVTGSAAGHQFKFGSYLGCGSTNHIPSTPSACIDHREHRQADGIAGSGVTAPIHSMARAA